MIANMDDINVLAGRSLVYKVFQSLFGNPPSRQQLEVAAGETVLDSVHLLSEGSIDDSLIDRFVQEAEWSISHMEETRRSYDRLFVGPGFLPAPPWESVYICGERLLFQKSTLAIRKEYLDMGLLPTRYPHVADDHLALELDYMAFLSDHALASL